MGRFDYHLRMSASWIVKPVSSLSKEEMGLWHSIRHTGTPLSQTIAWASAAESLNGECIAVFSPERQVSAIYFISNEDAECVNGPILNWENIRTSDDLNEQISMAVFALFQGCPWLKSIRIRPRLDQKRFLFLAKNSAFPITQTDLAQTLLIPLDDSPQKMWAQLPARIRHEVNRARSTGVKTETLDLKSNLSRFWNQIRDFYQSRNLFVPEEVWIRSLLTHFFDFSSLSDPVNAPQLTDQYAQIIRSSHPDSGSFSEILVLHLQDISYYFYAHEQRTESCPNISLNACAQWEAIQSAALQGSTYYDLNGVLHPDHQSPETETYRGVDTYKRKFKGKELDYFSPLITFSNRE
jgi:hypothetical protein